MELGANRFVAGTTLKEALVVARALNRQRIGVTLDHLGEEAASAADQQTATSDYLEALNALFTQQLDGGVSIKLSMVGEGAWAIVESAAKNGQLVWLDMENSATTETTLRTCRTLAIAYPGAVGAVLQAYLYRSAEDLEALLTLEQPSVRIVKGAYLEPVSVAWQDKADVDRNYLALVKRAIEGGAFTAVATHDQRVINTVLELLHRPNVAPARVEFQMLYGLELGVLEHNARAFPFSGDSQEGVKPAAASWPPCGVFLSSLGPGHSASPYPRMPLRHSRRSRLGAKSTVSNKTSYIVI